MIIATNNRIAAYLNSLEQKVFVNGVDKLFFLGEDEYGRTGFLQTFQQVNHLRFFFHVFHFLRISKRGMAFSVMTDANEIFNF